jgi:undecaprenyl-diphosphatase
MSLFQAIVLGLVQGLTEFLPISSSGHLVLIPQLLGWTLDEGEAFVFFVLVQWGTLLAVLAYFWHDLLIMGRDVLAGLEKNTEVSENARLGWLVLLATLPALLAGLLIKDQVQAAFKSLSVTGYFLLVTALLLLLGERLSKHDEGTETLGKRDALVIGLFQVLALFPGVSRSGATITGGMLSQLRRRAAARFSFLMAVPVMISAGALALLDLSQMAGRTAFIDSLVAGFVVSAITGYFAIRWLLNYLSTRSLIPFAIYCSVLGLIAIFAA